MCVNSGLAKLVDDFYPPRSVLFGALCRWVFAVIVSVFGQSEVFTATKCSVFESESGGDT